MDVSQLTDAELRENLKSHGCSVGPIVASTRSLYEKKLLKLCGNTTNNKSQNDSVDLNTSQVSENGDFEGAAEQSFEPIFKKIAPQSAAIKKPDTFQQQPSSAESDSDDCEESMRFLTEEEMAADRASARQAALYSNEKKSGGFFGNTITVIVIFVFIAVFAYFLIENAEQLKLLAEPNVEDAV